MKLSDALDQYEKICLEALQQVLHYNAKLTCLKPVGRRLRNLVAQILLLHLVIPHKINYTQMEKYGTHTEKTYRQAHLEKINWLKFNLALMNRLYEAGQRIAIAIDPSYIPKSGKCTPWTGMFWSGCAKAAKWGLEILSVAAINIDLHESFSLVAEQSPNAKSLERTGMSLMDWYVCTLRKYAATLLDVSKYVVADAAFSNSTFIEQIIPIGVKHRGNLYIRSWKQSVPPTGYTNSLQQYSLCC